MKKNILIALSALALSAQAQTNKISATNDTIALVTFPGFKPYTTFKPTTYANYIAADTTLTLTAKYKAKKLVGNTALDTIITVVNTPVQITNNSRIHTSTQSFNNTSTIYGTNLGLQGTFNVFTNNADNNNSVLAASSNYAPGTLNTVADNWFLIGPIKVPSAAMIAKFSFGFTNDNKRDGFEIRTIQASKLDAKPSLPITPNGAAIGKYTNVQLTQLATNNSVWDSTKVMGNNFKGFKQATLMAAPIAKTWIDNDDDLAAPAVTPAKPYVFTFDKSAMFSRQVNLTSYRGQDVYVAIHHIGNQQDIVFFDDILIKEASLPAPFGFSSITNNDNVIVYPNPANETLNIIGANNATILITNTLGQVVKNATNASSINIADLTAGMYLVTIVNENETIIKKIVKN
jgi:hypothetical protein